MEHSYRRASEECYKSKNEIQIARFLERNGIAFQYEYPLAVRDKGKMRIWYPDFRLPELGMIVEYFGVNGRSSYDEQVQHKLQVYKEAGIEGIFLNQASFRGDWPGRILGQIEDILKNRLDRFHDRQELKTVG